MKEPVLEQRYTVAQVAALLGVHPATVWRYMRDGKIDPRGVEKIGRRTTRIRASVINKFLTGCTAA